jgi:hypothetical protein
MAAAAEILKRGSAARLFVTSARLSGLAVMKAEAGRKRKFQLFQLTTALTPKADENLWIERPGGLVLLAPL